MWAALQLTSGSVFRVLFAEMYRVVPGSCVGAGFTSQTFRGDTLVMTTRTRIQTRWIPSTRVHRQAVQTVGNRPFSPFGDTIALKPYTAAEGDLDGLIRNYGYLLFQPNGHLWLAGLAPAHRREAVAQQIRERVLAAKANEQPGPSQVHA